MISSWGELDTRNKVLLSGLFLSLIALTGALWIPDTSPTLKSAIIHISYIVTMLFNVGFIIAVWEETYDLLKNGKESMYSSIDPSYTQGRIFMIVYNLILFIGSLLHNIISMVLFSGLFLVCLILESYVDRRQKANFLRAKMQTQQPEEDDD